MNSIVGEAEIAARAGLAYVVSQGNITATNNMVRHNNRRKSRTKLPQRKIIISLFTRLQHLFTLFF